MHYTTTHTRIACYTGYVIQAIVNLFPPLLFVQFREEFGVSITQLTLIVTANFATQITTDLAATPFILRYGYRVSMVAAQVCAILGLFSLALLPGLIPSHPYVGILMAMLISAIGGGLMEVLVSPVVQSLPSRDKVAEMGFLHSAYCWGAVLVILLSTVCFSLFGIEHWRWVAIGWAVIPLLNGYLLMKVPIATPEDEGGRGMSLLDLLRSPVFALLVVIMICSGASELAMSQWASYFAEKGLRVVKTTGDLLGPCAFAGLMALSRMIFGFCSQRLPLRKALLGTSLLCVAAYALTVFSPSPVYSLVGCGICGFSVGIMWSGTFSLGTIALPRGGTLMFALLAFAGDIGCAVGPSVVGLISTRMERLGHGLLPIFGSHPETASLKSGMLCVSVFPMLLAIALLLLPKRGSEKK